MESPVSPVVPRLLREAQVLAQVPFGKSTLYAMVGDGLFPAPVKIGARAIAWLEPEVAAWLERRIATRDAKLAALGNESKHKIGSGKGSVE
jgi:prophage regulatory protein